MICLYKIGFVGILGLMLAFGSGAAFGDASWNGVLIDDAAKPVTNAEIRIRGTKGNPEYRVTTGEDGKFVVANMQAGSYEVTVRAGEKEWRSRTPLMAKDLALELTIEISAAGEVLLKQPAQTSAQASGGEHLSSSEVSSLPLNVRDFSKLLLLAAGTMTDTNGATNFTTQFAVNGQRGVTTVFSMDGFDTTDPEMGGATFSNFNVDAIQEVQSNSGVMSADIGHGAAAYTNVVTKAGVNQMHGAVFEFLRNAALDARNYFDYIDPTGRRRIPPFIRNEFGFANGGPVALPGIYDGRDRSFYFGEYQGFRQVLGTTQVIPVPTAAERQGIDTTTYPGDTLLVPVSAQAAGVLNGYPLPNEPSGPFGDRTFAGFSKVVTRTDQFSIRIDHKISDKASLSARFSLNQVSGPLTNPDQTAINPSFGILFFDHQRNAGVHCTRTISGRLVWDTSLSYIRSTPFFPTKNRTQPGITYADGLYQPYYQPAGSIFGSYSNLYQIKHDFSWTHASHVFKWGAEIRANRDSTIFGVNPNGIYEFGGGAVYAPYNIPSASGAHNISQGQQLPDSLTGLLTGTPYSYNVDAPAAITPVGSKFDEAGVRREAYAVYFEDAWKVTAALSVSYGLRYEVNSRIHEASKRTSLPIFLGADGRPVSYLDRTATQQIVINPQPPYDLDWNGWGPRLAVDCAAKKHTMLHAGGAITTLIPNLWQDNALTAGIPYAFMPSIFAHPGDPVVFTNTFVPLTLPTAYNVQGQAIFATGRTQDVPANTVFDYARFQSDLNVLTPGNVQLIGVPGIAKNWGNGYMGSWTAGFDHDFGDFKFNASYVGTAGIHLARYYNPNGYGGACQGFAPFTQFDTQCHATGGFGPETIMSSGSHSSYHALQTSLNKNSPRLGLGLQASYTYSKALDDTSAALGGLFGTSGTVLQTAPQNPWDPSADKGPSTFDVAHAFAASVIQVLPLERVRFLRPLGKAATGGWQLLNITTLTTGSPFTVYSGVQQTGAGLGGGDRPDLISMPRLSTSGPVASDYFGRGADNPSLFYIPIHTPGGTGPNQGRFGRLGRNTFRGPDYHDYDIAVIKDTPLGRRGSTEVATLEFRGEFFNLFNLVNFGLPSNIVEGSGFGMISKTNGTSRQIQFSLKVIY
jgi:Carboxypeptidase regulatory-like domain/TonB dependent receptor